MRIGYTTLRRGQGIFVACSVVLLGAFADGSSVHAVVRSPSAQSLVRTAMHNALGQRWVHETVQASSQGHTLTMTNDIGINEGRQVIDADGARAMVILVNATAYIEGDAKAIANYFQLQAPDPAKLAGKWISITSGDSEYLAVTEAVTLKSDFGQNTLKGPFTKGRVTKEDGREVTPIHAFASSPSALPVPVTLDVTAKGTVLPIAIHTSSKQIAETVAWSRWGQAVVLVPPPSAVPISTVQP